MSSPASPIPAPASAPAPAPIHDPRRAALWMVGALLSFSVVAISGREAMRAIGALELMFWRAAIGGRSGHHARHGTTFRDHGRAAG